MLLKGKTRSRGGSLSSLASSAGKYITNGLSFLIPYLFLEVDARHDADCDDAEEENCERQQVGRVHSPYLKKQIHTFILLHFAVCHERVHRFRKLEATLRMTQTIAEIYPSSIEKCSVNLDAEAPERCSNRFTLKTYVIQICVSLETSLRKSIRSSLASAM